MESEAGQGIVQGYRRCGLHLSRTGVGNSGHAGGNFLLRLDGPEDCINED